MNINHVKIVATCIIIIIPSVYFCWFGIHLKSPLSLEQEVWGQMGDFLGGVMNPLLTFITVILLITSINHQIEANQGLTNQIRTMEKSEKIKIFENLFFHLVLSQQNLYSNFKISIMENGEKKELSSIQAVAKIESIFQEERKIKTYEELKKLYLSIDKQYGVFDILRAFSVIVYLIKEQLSDDNGFSSNERIFYYEKLINLTEFAHLRLICTANQFQNETGAGKKLQDNEFQEVCEKLKYRINDYYQIKS